MPAVDPFPLCACEQKRMVAAAYYSHNTTALKIANLQNKNGLTETMIFPSGVCFTLNPTSFCAVTSATVTYNSPLQVTSALLDFFFFLYYFFFIYIYSSCLFF